MKRRTVLAGAGALGAALVARAPIARAAEKVKLTLNWAAGPYHECFFYADKLGYYREAGLDVEIEPGRGSVATIQLVAAGRTDIGMADGSAIFSLASRGAPIKAIAAIRQESGYCIMVHANSPIKAPKDLEGRKLGLAPGATQTPLFDTLVAVQKIDKTKVEIVSVDDSAILNLFAERKIDSFINIPGFILPRLKERGLEVRSLYLRDYGVPMLGHSLAANESVLKSRPDMVRKFVAATLRGLGAAMANPVAAVDALLAKFPNAGGKESLLFTVKDAVATMYCLKDAPGLGMASQAILDGSYAVMTGHMNLPKDKPVGFYVDASFLPKPLPKCP